MKLAEPRLELVLTLLRKHPSGLTNREIAAKLGIGHSDCMNRTYELKVQGLIDAFGKKPRTFVMKGTRPVSEVQKSLTDRAEKILALVRARPGLKAAELQPLVGYTDVTTLHTSLARLVERGLLRREKDGGKPAHFFLVSDDEPARDKPAFRGDVHGLGFVTRSDSKAKAYLDYVEKNPGSWSHEIGLACGTTEQGATSMLLKLVQHGHLHREKKSAQRGGWGWTYFSKSTTKAIPAPEAPAKRKYNTQPWRPKGKSLELMEVCRKSPGQGIGDYSRALGSSRANAFRCAELLVKHGYLRHEGTGALTGKRVYFPISKPNGVAASSTAMVVRMNGAPARARKALPKEIQTRLRNHAVPLPSPDLEQARGDFRRLLFDLGRIQARELIGEVDDVVHDLLEDNEYTQRRRT